MEITVTKQTGKVSVAVIELNGQLDGQTYQALIASAKEVYGGGAKDILLDLTNLTYISSAGLVAFHAIAMMLRGNTIPSSEAGWASMQSVQMSGADKAEEHIKLLNPRAEVKSVLEMVGFDRAFEMYTDVQQALDSF